MKRETRLYNVLFPIWLLWLYPKVLLFVIPGNLLIDCLVLFFTLLAMKHARKATVLKKLWWKFWLLGFAADLVGAVWMFLGWFLCGPLGDRWQDTVGHITHNAFAHPVAFLWTFIGVACAGVCIYAFDLRAMGSCRELTIRERRRVALVMAVVTAPWLFFIPIY